MKNQAFEGATCLLLVMLLALHIDISSAARNLIVLRRRVAKDDEFGNGVTKTTREVHSYAKLEQDSHDKDDNNKYWQRLLQFSAESGKIPTPETNTPSRTSSKSSKSSTRSSIKTEDASRSRSGSKSSKQSRSRNTPATTGKSSKSGSSDNSRSTRGGKGKGRGKSSKSGKSGSTRGGNGRGKSSKSGSSGSTRGGKGKGSKSSK